MTKNKTYRIYSPAVGRPGLCYYRPERTFGTIEAPTKMRALDGVAKLIGEQHIERHHKIAVLGIGSITVREESA